MAIILEPFREAAATGWHMEFGDRLARTAFPLFPVLSSDLEEQ